MIGGNAVPHLELFKVATRSRRVPFLPKKSDLCSRARKHASSLVASNKGPQGSPCGRRRPDSSETRLAPSLRRKTELQEEGIYIRMGRRAAGEIQRGESNKAALAAAFCAAQHDLRQLHLRPTCLVLEGLARFTIPLSKRQSQTL